MPCIFLSDHSVLAVHVSVYFAPCFRPHGQHVATALNQVSVNQMQIDIVLESTCQRFLCGISYKPALFKVDLVPGNA